MGKSKKIFLGLSIVFFLIMIAIGIDISRKTTFPGSKGYLKESIIGSESDSTKQNSKKDTLDSE
ncbi:MAG TPA: hypothetical protein DDY13_01990 [Cytophagales bacterium]|nr:hypothetical protein [Cytophagales bacterium]